MARKKKEITLEKKEQPVQLPNSKEAALAQLHLTFVGTAYNTASALFTAFLQRGTVEEAYWWVINRKDEIIAKQRM